MPAGRWYTLIRMRGGPQRLTAVAQVRSAHEAMALLSAWEARFPEEIGVVFDPEDTPIERFMLEWQAGAEERGRRHEPSA